MRRIIFFVFSCQQTCKTSRRSGFFYVAIGYSDVAAGNLLWFELSMADHKDRQTGLQT
jgi:hypothetical protein